MPENEGKRGVRVELTVLEEDTGNMLEHWVGVGEGTLDKKGTVIGVSYPEPIRLKQGHYLDSVWIKDKDGNLTELVMVQGVNSEDKDEIDDTGL